jgi:hypothetical protein
MPNNNFRFNTDQATAFLIHQAAARQGRAVADFIRRAVDQHINANPQSDAAVETLNGSKHKPVITAAYLSGTLAAAVKQIAAETDRSTSYVMRWLIRDALRARGLLPSPATVEAAPTTI